MTQSPWPGLKLMDTGLQGIPGHGHTHIQPTKKKNRNNQKSPGRSLGARTLSPQESRADGSLIPWV